MKNYELIENDANKAQYSYFLKQYNDIKNLKVKTTNQDSYLVKNHYRLNVVWLNEDGTQKDEFIEIPKEVLDKVMKEINDTKAKLDIDPETESVKPKAKRKYNKKKITTN